MLPTLCLNVLGKQEHSVSDSDSISAFQPNKVGQGAPGQRCRARSPAQWFVGGPQHLRGSQTAAVCTRCPSSPQSPPLLPRHPSSPAQAWCRVMEVVRRCDGGRHRQTTWTSTHYSLPDLCGVCQHQLSTCKETMTTASAISLLLQRRTAQQKAHSE